MVLRDGEYLKAIDYVDYFKDDFNKIANELEEASKTSTNKDFNEFLTEDRKMFKEYINQAIYDAEDYRRNLVKEEKNFN